MMRSIAIVTSAVMLAVGAAGAASAMEHKKAPTHHVIHARSQASQQCSAEANAKGLHGKARSMFRHSCLHTATYHKPVVKHVHHTAMHHKLEKAAKKT